MSEIVTPLSHHPERWSGADPPKLESQIDCHEPDIMALDYECLIHIMVERGIEQRPWAAWRHGPK